MKSIGNGKRTIIDILRVSISNIIKLVSGILVGFLLPKIIGVTDYGFYRTFTLYSTYVGLFHFGMADGLYLKYGGYDYEELEKDKMRYFTRFFIVMELIVSMIVGLLSITILEGEYRFIFICVAIYLLVHNITGYYQSISQATKRFKELSQRNVIQSVVTALSIVALWLLHTKRDALFSYRIYTVIYVAIATLLSIWYIYTYKDITFSNYKKTLQEIPQVIRLGFPLMIANLCSSLILTLDRQFVNVLFNKDIYAVYAFAYSLLSLVTTATSAISTVLYPSIKRADANSLKKIYSNLISTILTLVYVCMIIFFPLHSFVEWFLPKYTGSLVIFRIIFPGLAISSAITIVMHNYYKALNKTFSFFIKSVVTLIISCIANLIAYLFFRTTAAISIASILTMIIWYIYVEHLLIKQLNVEWKKNFIFMIIMMIAFYNSTSLNRTLFGGLSYLLVLILLTRSLTYKDIRRLLFKH